MPPDATILAFDTSAAQCAAALLSGDRILAERAEDMSKGQAERLMPLLQELLAEAGLGWPDLDGIGVGIGPGNFTGIRISVSAARGLALALKRPAIGVSAFEALAEGAEGVAVTTRDARQGSIYLQILGDRSGAEPVTCTLDTLPDLPGHTKPTIIGFEADRIAARYGGKAAQPAYPIAVAIARIAARRLESGARRPSPLYIRAADAAPPRDTAPRILP